MFSHLRPEKEKEGRDVLSVSMAAFPFVTSLLTKALSCTGSDV